MPINPMYQNYQGMNQGYYGFQQQNQQIPQQIQNGGFVCVRNEAEAMSYPVAPGNSITFKDETAPYVYTKTMGFSQLDRPIFEKFRLVKEEAVEAPGAGLKPPAEEMPARKFEAEIEAVRGDITALREEVEALKKKIPAKPRKKEAEEDE